MPPSLPRLTALAATGLLAGCFLPGSDPLNTPAPSYPPVPPLGSVGVSDLPVWPRMHEAPNGLRSVWETTPGGGLAAVVVTLGAGSVNDPVGREGIAHLVEHLTFRAADERGVSRWDRLREIGAATINAGTDHDKVSYYQVVPASRLTQALAIEGERLAAPLRGVSPEVFEIERNVVRNELRERDETGVTGQIVAWMQELLFPANHPYGRPIGGTQQSVAALTPQDAAAFAARHYTPANATVTVTGDVSDADLRSAHEQLQRALGQGAAVKVTREAPPALRSAFDPPPPPPGWFFRRKSSLSSPELWIGWTVPGAYSVYRPYLQVGERFIEHALVNLHKTDPDVASVGAFSNDGIAAAVLGVRISLLRGEAPERTAQTVLQVLGRAISSAYYRTAGAGDDVPVLQLQAMSSLFLSAERPLGRALAYSSFAHAAGRPDLYPAGFRALSNFRAPDLGRYASTYLRPERARALFVEPDVVRPGAVTGVGTRLAGAARKAAPAPTAAAIGAMVAPLGATALDIFRLRNGLEVILFPRPGYPVAAAVLGFHGGSAKAAPMGVEVLAGQAAHELKFCGGAPSSRGISLMSIEDDDASLDLATGAAANLSAVLLGLAERAATYRWDRWPALFDVGRSTASFVAACDPVRVAAGRAAYWESVRERGDGEYRRSFQVEAKDPRARAAQALADRLLADTPYARRLTPEAAQRIGAGDLARWYDRTRVPENAFLVVAGSFEPSAARALVHGWFDAWQPSGLGRNDDPPRRLPTPGERGGLLFQARPGASQAEITLGCTMPDELGARSVTHELLARYLSVQLAERLRARMGATYGVHASVRSYRAGFSQLILDSALENQRLEAALLVLRDTWSRLGAGFIDEQALADARWDLARSANDSRSALSLAVSVARMRALGRDPRQLDRFGQRLAAVRVEDLLEVFDQCRQRATLSLIGEESLLRAAAKASLGAGLPR